MPFDVLTAMDRVEAADFAGKRSQMQSVLRAPFPDPLPEPFREGCALVFAPIAVQSTRRTLYQQLPDVSEMTPDRRKAAGRLQREELVGTGQCSLRLQLGRCRLQVSYGGSVAVKLNGSNCPQCIVPEVRVVDQTPEQLQIVFVANTTQRLDKKPRPIAFTEFKRAEN